MRVDKKTAVFCVSALTLCLAPAPVKAASEIGAAIKRVRCIQEIDPITGKLHKVCGNPPIPDYSNYPNCEGAGGSHSHQKVVGGDPKFLLGQYGVDVGSDWRFAGSQACLYRDVYSLTASPEVNIVQTLLQSKTDSHYYCYVYVTTLDASPKDDTFSTKILGYNVKVEPNSTFNSGHIKQITSWYPETQPSQNSGSATITIGKDLSVSFTNYWQTNELSIVSKGGTNRYEVSYDVITPDFTVFNTNAVRFIGGFIFESDVTSFNYFDVSHKPQFFKGESIITANLNFTLGLQLNI